MKKSKEKRLIIALAVLLFIIVLLVVLLSRSISRPISDQPVSTIGPSVFPTIRNNISITPQVSENTIYDKSRTRELLQRIQERPSLSASDSAVVSKILSALPTGRSSGTLHQSPRLKIDYIKGPNLFQVEILTVNVAQAKTEGNNWFLTQGLSQEAICNYPVDFYLNWNVANQLKDNNVQFDPLGPGC